MREEGIVMLKRVLRATSIVVLVTLILSACAPAPAATTAAPEPTQAPVATEPTAAPTTAPEPTAPTEAATAKAPTTDISAAPKTLRLPDLKGRAIKAVTENAYTPLNFVDAATGKAVGWEYEATEEICRRLNCKVEWGVTSWDAMIPAVKGGQFDVGMDGITINDERKKEVDFSDPYMSSQQYMLVRADEERFKTAAEFKANNQLLIGSQAGTTNFYTAVYNVLDGNEQNPRIKLFETFGAAVQALLAGDVDTVLMDAASSKGYVGANPGKLKVLDEALGSDQFGFIFTPKSDLVAPFNAAIKTLKDDGYADYLNTRWFYLYDANSK
jgi:polar amino acid transport system substrate-binding protein